MRRSPHCHARAIVALITLATAMSAAAVAVAADRIEPAAQTLTGIETPSASGPTHPVLSSSTIRVASAEAPADTATVDTIYVPDLVSPEAEQKEEHEVLLDEGPDIEVRFGKSLKDLTMEKQVEQGEFSVTPSISYDRVDGLSLFLNEDFSAPERLYPKIHLLEGYAFDSRKWRYRLDFEQPLFSPNSFSFGASVYLITDTFDKELTGNIENSLSSLFFKKDFRDYFEREGASVFVRQKFLNWNSVTLQYAEDTYRSVESISKGLFYRRSRTFRENPEVYEGKWATVTALYELDSRQDEQEGPTEHWYRVEWESGRHKDEPCAEYTRLAADLRTYLNLNPGQYLSCRLKLGATPSGTLPFQKEFCVGGIGTMAAHDFKEFRGDHMILFNAEYAIDVVKRFQAILITDVGKAWFGRDALKDQSLDLDVGIGVGVKEGIRVFAAKSPREAGSDVVWTLRLERTF